MSTRTLVVCYSRGGSTFHVGEYLAKALDADLERITEPNGRAGVSGYARSAIEALAKGLPTIQVRTDPRDYELVVLGTPVWVGTMASPVRSYLYQHAHHLVNPAFFAVMGGRGGNETVSELKLACGASVAPTCVLTQSQVRQGRFLAVADAFVRSLRQRMMEREPMLRETAA